MLGSYQPGSSAGSSTRSAVGWPQLHREPCLGYILANWIVARTSERPVTVGYMGPDSPVRCSSKRATPPSKTKLLLHSLTGSTCYFLPYSSQRITRVWALDEPERVCLGPHCLAFHFSLGILHHAHDHYNRVIRLVLTRNPVANCTFPLLPQFHTYLLGTRMGSNLWFQSEAPGVHGHT